MISLHIQLRANPRPLGAPTIQVMLTPLLNGVSVSGVSLISSCCCILKRQRELPGEELRGAGEEPVYVEARLRRGHKQTLPLMEDKYPGRGLSITCLLGFPQS